MEVVSLSKLKSKNKQRANYDRQDLRLLKASIYYFYKLRSEGKISNNTLHRLTRYSCALFVENQIESIYQKIIDERLSQLWELEVSNIKNEFDDLYSYQETSKILKSLKKAYV